MAIKQKASSLLGSLVLAWKAYSLVRPSSADKTPEPKAETVTQS
jgi:hypothetical protein